jgi:26S proteasome regulatory subunit N1
LISNVLGDPNASMEVIGVASLSLGLIAIGSADGDVTSTLMQTLLEKSEIELKDTFSKYLALSIGLIYLGSLFYIHPCFENISNIFFLLRTR